MRLDPIAVALSFIILGLGCFFLAWMAFRTEDRTIRLKAEVGRLKAALSELTQQVNGTGGTRRPRGGGD